jgi:hypothetical protein
MEKEQPKTVNIPFSLCNNICRHLSTLEIYLKGEHNHETDAIQEKEDWELYQESIRLKDTLELCMENQGSSTLSSELLKAEIMNVRLDILKEFINNESPTVESYEWAIKNILGISDDNSKK